MIHEYLDLIEKLKDSNDLEFIQDEYINIFEKLSNEQQDPEIVNFHEFYSDDIIGESNLTIVQIWLDELYREVDKYIKNSLDIMPKDSVLSKESTKTTTFSKDNKKLVNDLRDLSEDLRLAIYSDDPISELLDLDFDDIELPTKIENKLANLYEKIDKVYTDDGDVFNVVKKFYNKLENDYNFKLDPYHSKKERTSAKEVIEELTKIKNQKFLISTINTAFAKIDFSMKDLDILESQIDEFNIAILPDNAKKIISKMIEEMNSFYEIKIKDNFKNKKTISTFKPEPIVKREDLINLDDIKENKEFNKILKIFHNIAKPHIDDSKLPVNISEKEISILSAIIQKLGKKSLEDINIKWNPMVGLFIESKEGFEKENQKLIMSHSDLVGTFQKMHQDVKDGKRKSAIQLGDDGLLSGSLDNTMTNAIVLNNYLEGRLEDNVSILFDRGEETGMWGAQNFHDGKHDDKWVQIELDTDSMKLSSMSTTAPITQKDCIVINTDVTMGYKEPYAFEVRDFDKETKKGIKNAFIKGAMSNYNHDDSADTVAKINPTMSFCFTVGSNKTKLKSGEYKFSGGCHSEFTFTTKFNIESYSEDFSPFINSIGNELEIKLDLTPATSRYKRMSTYSDYINDHSYKYDLVVNVTDDDKLELVKETVADAFLSINMVIENLNEFEVIQLSEPELKDLLEELGETFGNLELKDYKNFSTLNEFYNLLARDMTDKEYTELYMDDDDNWEDDSLYGFY